MVKVTVLGAAGGIGQPLSLLLKLNPKVSELLLFDIVNAKGVAADLSHINTPATVQGFQPANKEDKTALTEALKGTDVVVIPAGVPRKPGMTRADLFNINALIVRDLVAAVGKTAPDAAILIISNPVNSTVAIAASVLQKLGVFKPQKLFGVTTLDIVRAETFLGGIIGEDPSSLRGKISVIGGHSGDTIVPLLNFDPLLKDKVLKISSADYKEFVHRVQFGGDEVVKAKNGAGSATLSMAFAGYRFAENIIDSANGKELNQKIPDSAYVYLPGFDDGKPLAEKYGVDFLAVPVHLKNGQVLLLVAPEKVIGTSQEHDLLKVALDGLEKSIVQGKNFVEGSKI